jgi:hypothetical protein
VKPQDGAFGCQLAVAGPIGTSPGRLLGLLRTKDRALPLTSMAGLCPAAQLGVFARLGVQRCPWAALPEEALQQAWSVYSAVRKARARYTAASARVQTESGR